jgi:hypothetical protein
VNQGRTATISISASPAPKGRFFEAPQAEKLTESAFAAMGWAYHISGFIVA